MLEKNINIYDYYTNYLYEVKEIKGIIEFKEKKYILFNPSIHYWISLDEIGKEIYEMIRNIHNLKIVKENLMKKYNIKENEFDNDVLPFIEQLLKYQFFSLEETFKGNLEWMNKVLKWDDIENYPLSEIYISLSDVCNLNCLYCFNKENRKIRCKTKHTLSKEKIIDIMVEFKKIGGKKVIFTGGEPTLNKNLPELCKAAHEIGLENMIITNGTLLKDIELEKIIKHIDEIGISIDSIYKKELKILWGKEDISLEQDVFLSLKILNKLSQDIKKINITIMPVITNLNYKSIYDLTLKINELLKDCNLKWYFTQYKEIGVKEIDNLLSISKQEYITSITTTFRRTNTLNENEALCYALGNGGKELPEKTPHIVVCSPGFFITNSGDVYPCQGTENEKYYLGSIFEQSLKDLFYSKKFNEIRNKLYVNKLDKCGKCELRFVCVNEERPCWCGEGEKDCRDKFIQKLYINTILKETK